ncbi:MAG: hypothetical protein IJ281_05510 [Clostridia bacterium]|nr:hypothetical protein [Clostridia bacterium]
MKKYYITMVIMTLVVLMAIGVAASDSNAKGLAVPEGDAVIAAAPVCTNHNYTELITDGNVENDIANQVHRLRCTATAGCTSYSTESCYTYYCDSYDDIDMDRDGKPDTNRYVTCAVCARGSLPVHDFQLQHIDGTTQHALVCVNSAPPYVVCGAELDNSLEDCTYGTTQVWRGYFSGQGHRLSRECTACGEVYYTGYYNPPGHPSALSPESCVYCDQEAPYHMDFIG